jgi:glycosyltransferase involved in cell wall biosynthesis
MAEPTVAVVMPAYNAERYIAEALASIDAQTRAPDEVIIVDDGSRDRTLAIAREWAATRGASTTVLTGPNGGQALARNRAILASRSAVIALLDADDVWLPDHLARMLPAMRCTPAPALVFSDAIMTDAAGVRGESALARTRDRLLAISTPVPGTDFREMGPTLRALMLETYDLLPSILLIPRETFARVGLFDARLRYAEDVEFIARVLPRGSCLFQVSPTVLRRVHEAGISRPRLGARQEEWLTQVLARIVAYDPTVTPAEREVIGRMLAGSTWNAAWEAAQFGPRALRHSLALSRQRMGGRPVRGRPRLWLTALRAAMRRTPRASP